MRERAQSFVIVLLCLATLIGFTSAIGSDEMVAVGSDPSGDSTGFETGPLTTDGDGASSTGPGTGTSGTSASGGIGADGGSDTTVGPGGGGPGSGGGGGGGGGGGPGGGGGAPDPALAPLKIAYIVSDLTGTSSVAGNSSFQNEGDEAARQDREFRALVDEVNATGGLAGRRVEARGYKVSVTEDENRLLQRCVEITEDYGASYVIDTIMLFRPTLQQCFAQHRVGLIAISSGLNEAVLGQFSPYVATTWPTVDRQFATVVPKLQELNWFTGPNFKLGVYLDEEPNLDEPYQRILKPALQRAGMTPVEARSRPADANGLASAFLKFNDAHVTHIVFVGTTGSFFNFSNTAEAQLVRFHYALTDYQALMSGASAFANPNQLAKAVGVSACCVVDPGDRSPSDTTTPFDRERLTPGKRRCLDALTRVRGTDYYRPAESGGSALWTTVCDHFFLWLDAMRAAGRATEPARFGAAVRALGQSYPSSVVYATDFSDGRQAGATHFATGAYKDSCRCFERRTAWSRPG